MKNKKLYGVIVLVAIIGFFMVAACDVGTSPIAGGSGLTSPTAPAAPARKALFDGGWLVNNGAPNTIGGGGLDGAGTAITASSSTASPAAATFASISWAGETVLATASTTKWTKLVITATVPLASGSGTLIYDGPAGSVNDSSLGSTSSVSGSTLILDFGTQLKAAIAASPSGATLATSYVQGIDAGLELLPKTGTDYSSLKITKIEFVE